MSGLPEEVELARAILAETPTRYGAKGMTAEMLALVLVVEKYEGTIGGRGLAALLDVPRVTMTKMVDAAVSAGLLARGRLPRDRRVAVLFTTKKTRHLRAVVRKKSEASETVAAEGVRE